jgi:ParB family transcriptional regulator, chromosome partitioning protein
MQQQTRKELLWFKRGTNVRKKERSHAELRELGKGLRQRQLSPVWAKPDGTLLIGYGRLDAAELEGLDALDVVITDEPLTEADVLIIQAQENMLRQDLSDFDKVCMVERLRDLRPKLMAKELADSLHVDPSTITRLLSASKVIPAAREALQAGAITISHVYAMSRASEQQQHELLRLALGGASRDALENESRKRRPGKGSAVRLSRVRCPLPKVTVIVSGEGIGLDESIDAVLAAAKEMKRARDEGLDAKTAQAVWQKRITKAAS